MSINNFNCLKCNSTGLQKCEIVILTCRHTYCWTCMGEYINSNLSINIKCPSQKCQKNINDNIIRKALPESRVEDFDKLCLEPVLDSGNNCFKCLYPECGYISFSLEKNIQFECPRCTLFNCTKCRGTHPIMSCKKYQELKKTKPMSNADKLLLQSMQANEFSRAKTELQKFTNNNWHSKLKTLELTNTVPNDETFTCSVCFKVVSKGTGIKLRNCFHTFCRDCLRSGVKNSSTIPVYCLEGSCKSTIQDREIQEILSKAEFDIFNDKTLTKAKSNLQNIFHCKKPDCKYYVIIDNKKLKSFTCQICQSVNCIGCNTIHVPPEDCKSYKLKSIQSNSDTKSIQYIKDEIKKGICMECTGCGSIIKKTSGCNWIKCPSCQLELCWVLKMPRWGPKGKGDISGGCRCGVDKKPCSKDCLYGCIPEDHC